MDSDWTEKANAYFVEYKLLGGVLTKYDFERRAMSALEFVNMSVYGKQVQFPHHLQLAVSSALSAMKQRRP